jgi:N-acetylglucosamine kinase-like BadF-type ATPase
MTKYFLGVDIGGSKSHAVIADETGHVVGVGQGGPGNHESVGLDGFRDVLHAVVNQACSTANIQKTQIAGGGLGVAGYDWPSDHEPHCQIIDALGLDAPYELVNDAVIGLIAGARQGWGVSVVAGTGNNCRGRDQQGREGRVAGVGFWTDEHGGGYELTAKGVQAVWLAWSKRGPETSLKDKFLARLGARDPLEMIEGLSRGRYHLNASDVVLVFQSAAEGDVVAQNCIRWVGHELGSLAVGVIRQLEFEPLEFDVVLTGSLYKGSPLIAESMAEVIHAVAPGARLVYLNAPPVVGGVLLGMQQAGLDFTPIRDRLVEETKQHLHWTDRALNDN